MSNCHKLPESNFNRRLLSVDEIVNEYTSLIAGMTARNPNLKILFTVSPIRHIRDGMHANQLSKSTLVAYNRPLAAIVSEAGFLLSCLRDST